MGLYFVLAKVGRSFQTLPGASFVVNGAAQAADLR